MRYPEVEKFLTMTIGLDSASIGPKSVERAVSARMKLTSIEEEAKYFALLQSSESERAALIESVVVPETWFFRDQEPFNYLRQYVVREWKPSNKNRIFRVLSVPCSTGEEPFSIAITLIEAGLAHKDFLIDAADISVRALQVAERGIYGKSSFREEDDDFVARYFSGTEKGLKVNERILKSVRFQRGNIIDPGFLKGRSPYDVIFCRNLLIYMTQEARKRVLNILDSILLNKGLFFAGHTETMLIRSYGYSIVKHPRVFACRKAERDNIVQVKRPERTRPMVNIGPFSVTSAPIVPPPPKDHPKAAQSIENTTPIAQENPEHLLNRVRELGNQGAIEEAAALCEKFLKEHSLNSEAYYMMGLLHDAANKHDLAEEFFLKALYLDPNNYPVLVKLYLLYEQRGDSTKANAYRERASRVQTQQRNNFTG